MAKKKKKKRKTFLPTWAIKKMQLKTTLRFYHTPVRISNIKNTTNNKSWLGCGEKGTLIYCWWKCKVVLPI
jgi:hypothetical protein